MVCDIDPSSMFCAFFGVIFILAYLGFKIMSDPKPYDYFLLLSGVQLILIAIGFQLFT